MTLLSSIAPVGQQRILRRRPLRPHNGDTWVQNGIVHSWVYDRQRRQGMKDALGAITFSAERVIDNNGRKDPEYTKGDKREIQATYMQDREEKPFQVAALPTHQFIRTDRGWVSIPTAGIQAQRRVRPLKGESDVTWEAAGSTPHITHHEPVWRVGTRLPRKDAPAKRNRVHWDWVRDDATDYVKKERELLRQLWTAGCGSDRLTYEGGSGDHTEWDVEVARHRIRQIYGAGPVWL